MCVYINTPNNTASVNEKLYYSFPVAMNVSCYCTKLLC